MFWIPHPAMQVAGAWNLLFSSFPSRNMHPEILFCGLRDGKLANNKFQAPAMCSCNLHCKSVDCTVSSSKHFFFLYLPSLLCFEFLELKASCHSFKALFKRLIMEFVLPNLSILQVFETVASKSWIWSFRK